MTCSVCTHAAVSAIDEALTSGSSSMRFLEVRYGISKSALGRHKAGHLDCRHKACEGSTQPAGNYRVRVRGARSPEAREISPPAPLEARRRQSAWLRAKGYSRDEIA